ncbi:hypothetical protein BH10ACI1_BH10ACI1_10790 [soil metagenome]
MAKFDNPLDNLKVASPCSVDWNAMYGDNRKRFCGDCKLNVYNLSGMTRSEAENLIMNAEGRLCVKFYSRADGSVITQDCPVGWAKMKQRTQIFVTAVASLLFTLFGAIGLVSIFGKSKLIGKIIPIPFVTPTPYRTMGIMAPTSPTPKKSPSPTATPREMMGKISIPKTEK